MTECFELMERLELCADYADIAGRELPEHIRKLPLNRLREALRQARTGVVFGEPKLPKAHRYRTGIDRTTKTETHTDHEKTNRNR